MNLYEAGRKLARHLDELERAGYAVDWDEHEQRYRVTLKADNTGVDWVEVGNPYGYWDVTCASSARAEKLTTDVTVPREAFDGLVKVAAHISAGRGAALSRPGAAYPDGTARRALGALDDAGLLPADMGEAVRAGAPLVSCQCGRIPDPGVCQADCGQGLPAGGHCRCAHEAEGSKTAEFNWRQGGEGDRRWVTVTHPATGLSQTAETRVREAAEVDWGSLIGTAMRKLREKIQEEQR